MPSNSLPDADLNLPEMKTKSPSCPAGGVHMYAYACILFPTPFMLHIKFDQDWPTGLRDIHVWKCKYMRNFLVLKGT